MKHAHIAKKTSLTQDELNRYSRHFSLPQVGIVGQEKLKSARVLCVGCGGLGSPLLLYLAAAGIGTIGIVDHDVIDLSNLQRQILFSTADVGKHKISVAKEKLLALNPLLQIEIHDTYLDQHNALAIIKDYEIVVDGTDNFAARYLVNDACFHLGKPNVYASIFQFDGQCSVFNFANGPCYRCLYPTCPPAYLIPNCAEGGVLGVLAGLMGSIQATEVIKIILNLGETLSGRLLTVNTLTMQFKEYAIAKQTECCLCQHRQAFESLDQHNAAHCSTDIEEISVQTLQQMLQHPADFILLDVREPYEYATCHLNGELMPFSQFATTLQTLDKTKNYILHCKIGVRSRQAAIMMRQAGFVSVKHVKGGIHAWATEIDRLMPVY